MNFLVHATDVIDWMPDKGDTDNQETLLWIQEILSTSVLYFY